MRNERIVVSRQALLDEVWGYHPFAETNTVDVFISNLRRKLESGGEPRVLHTVRGAGYVLRASMRTRLPVRLKLAVVTAALTFGILCLFAVVIGAVAEQRIRAGFDDDLRATAADLSDRPATRERTLRRARRSGRAPLLAGSRPAARRCAWCDREARSCIRTAGLLPLGPAGVEGLSDVGGLPRGLARAGGAARSSGRAGVRARSPRAGRAGGRRTSSTPSPRGASHGPSTGCGCSSPSACWAARCWPSSAGSTWRSARCARSPASPARRARWRARAIPNHPAQAAGQRRGGRPRPHASRTCCAS